MNKTRRRDFKPASHLSGKQFNKQRKFAKAIISKEIRRLHQSLKTGVAPAESSSTEVVKTVLSMRIPRLRGSAVPGDLT